MSVRRATGAKPLSLSVEERAFLDFVARLAVDDALREAKPAEHGAFPVPACGQDPDEEKSADHGDA